jgi:hypothetical protein
MLTKRVDNNAQLASAAAPFRRAGIAASFSLPPSSHRHQRDFHAEGPVAGEQAHLLEYPLDQA